MSDILITPGSGLIVFYSGDPLSGEGQLGRFEITSSGLSWISESGMGLTVDNLTIGSGITLPGIDELLTITPTDYVVVERSGVTYKTLVSELLSDAGSITGVAPNAGVAIDSGVLSTIYNTTIGDSVTNVGVGGASAGTAASVWKTKSVVEVLDDILFPTLLASIASNKSVSLAVDGAGGTLEIGSSYTRNLTASFSQGSITNGDGSSGPALVGAATQYTFTGTGISSTAQAGNTLALGSVTVVSGSNNWAVTVDHDAGTGAYYDNKGNALTNLDASRVSGSASDSASAPTITGLYPYFWGVSASSLTASDVANAIQYGSKTKVVASSNSTITISFNASAEYLWFAIPSTSTSKTVWYVNALNNGSIGGPSNLFGSESTQSVTSSDGFWAGVSYKIYITNYATSTGSDSMQLRNS